MTNLASETTDDVRDATEDKEEALVGLFLRYLG